VKTPAILILSSCIASAASAATLISHISSDVSYTWDATGDCGSDPATIHAVDSFDVKQWNTGRIVLKEQFSSSDIDDLTGKQIGRGNNIVREVGIPSLPFEMTVLNSFTCVGSGKNFAYTCGFHVNAEGVVTFSGSCYRQ
jgi:hypothetical protein